jgi:N6-L-threonylcarbamoyladenine synthase
LLKRTIERAGISLGEVDAFAATSGPGLASSLMVGASVAKGLALGFGKPYLAINHLEGHLLSPFFSCAGGIESNVSLIVSGGHTLLVDVHGVADYRIMGRTVDDAAGEAFDKVAKMLGLGYPGGPEIERGAVGGDPKRFDLPRSMLHSGDANFSFSGLKTAVRYLLPKVNSADTRDLCASFQGAVVDILVAKTIAAARVARRRLVTVSGGVSCNKELRAQMALGCENAGLEVRFAESGLCTDYAAMIAFVAMLRLERGQSTPLMAEIDPNLALA